MNPELNYIILYVYRMQTLILLALLCILLTPLVRTFVSFVLCQFIYTIVYGSWVASAGKTFSHCGETFSHSGETISHSGETCNVGSALVTLYVNIFIWSPGTMLEPQKFVAPWSWMKGLLPLDLVF